MGFHRGADLKMRDVLDTSDTTSIVARGTRPAHDVKMKCALSQPNSGENFHAALILEETYWGDDHHEPDVVQTTVCEIELNSSLGEAFAAVGRWLADGHRLRARRCSWQPRARPGDTWPLIAELAAHNRHEPNPRPAACTCLSSWILFYGTRNRRRR
jgi:hypothetical protein